jgi:hypothetical protein
MRAMASSACSAEPATEQRYLVVDGRRWRREDPSIPPPLAAELRAELMSARRAVAVALRAQDRNALAAARARVQDAKVALGERGTPWWIEWEARSPSAQTQRATATTRALLRRRGEGKTICPSDIARANAGSAWRAAMPMIRALVNELAARRELVVLQGGARVKASQTRGPIRIALPL